MASYPNTLRFGIPSLDILLGRRDEQSKKSDDFGIILNPKPQPDAQPAEDVRYSSLSVCVAGPSGTAKSLLALHLASRYAADTYLDQNTSVMYASTDLSVEQARRTWKEFDLSKAKENHSRFSGYDDPIENPDAWTATTGFPHNVDLKPLELANVPGYLLRPQPIPEDSDVAKGIPTDRRVGFVNLQSQTAGDDWLFLNNLLSLLDKPAGVNRCSHLLIVDAIEGLETLAGIQDGYGMERERRSRITQLIRSAAGKCHLLFVVEIDEEKDHPEKFVADVVLRLRYEFDRPHQYQRRTVEIEKARGQAHAAGRHTLLVRGRTGSSTGKDENPDDPPTEYAYVHVVPSIHFVARRIMWSKGAALPGPDGTHVASFGIRYLDDMLRLEEPTIANATDKRGIPAGTITALTGDDGTQKSRLTKAFAGQHFETYVDAAVAWILAQTPRTTERAHIPRRRRNVTQNHVVAAALPPENVVTGAINAMNDIAARTPIATVFITTQDIDAHRLVTAFVKQVTGGSKRWTEVGIGECIHQILDEHLNTLMRENVVCRRLEKHNISAPMLFHIIRECVRKAQKRVLTNAALDYSDSKLRQREGWRIRVVIEDWQVIHDTYYDVREDDTFLGMTLFYLCRQGATTLISHTRIGQPDAGANLEENRLQTEAHFNLRTWRIRFGDLDRVAIAARPPIATDRPSLIRQLAWESERVDDALTVDPILELYQGLHEGMPRLTPLRVRLFAESTAVVAYARRMERLFREKFPSRDQADITVHCADVDDPDGSGASYENLRDLCHLQGDVPLDHSLVFMTDEFWMVPDAG